MATLLQPYLVAVDGNGEPMAGAKLAFYVTGTSTPQAVYARADTTPGNELTNPVVANSDGLFPPIYLGDGSAYKMILRTSEDVVVSTVDPVLVPRANVITEEGSLIIGDAGGQPSELPIGAADRVLYSSGTTASWEQIALTSPVLIGVLPVSKGGTGTTTAALRRAYAYVTIAATVPTLAKQTGFASVVRDGLGLYTCTMTPAMPDANYKLNVTPAIAVSGSIPNGLIWAEDSGTARTSSVFHLVFGRKIRASMVVSRVSRSARG